MPSPEEDEAARREAVRRSLGLGGSRRRAEQAKSAENAEEPEASPELSVTGDPDEGGMMSAATTEAPEKKAEPERDTSLGIRRRSAPTSEEKPAERASSGSERRAAHAERGAKTAPVETGPALGTDPAALVLKAILKQVEGKKKGSSSKHELPFPEEWLGYKRTHGHYQGNGKDARTIKLGFRPIGVVFALPPIWQFEYEKIPPPTLTEDGFEVGPLLNKIGMPHQYVAFVLPEGEAPRPPPDAKRGAGHRERPPT